MSRRSLRPDPNFDSLLAKIFPDREEYEEQQEKALAILSRNHSAQLMSSIGDAIKAQAAHVRQMNKKKVILRNLFYLRSHFDICREKTQCQDSLFKISMNNITLDDSGQ